MFFVRESDLLAVVEADDSWAILFEGGHGITNVSKWAAHEIIGRVKMRRYADGTPVTLPTPEVGGPHPQPAPRS